jgi:hypothetical protein
MKPRRDGMLNQSSLRNDFITSLLGSLKWNFILFYYIPACTGRASLIRPSTALILEWVNVTFSLPITFMIICCSLTTL